MMKLKCTILLILSFLILNSSLCYASSEISRISPEIEYKPLENVYSVKGTFENEIRGNISVGLRVFYDDDGLENYDTYAWVGTTVANKNESGKVVFEFEPVAFKESALSGTYSFELTSFLTEPLTVSKEYLTNPDKLSLMKALDALAGDEYTAKLVADGGKLGADMSAFNNLSPSGKGMVSSKLSSISSGLENVTDQDSDYIQKTNAAVDVFLSNYNEFTAIEAFNDCSEGSKINAWILKYADKFALKNDRPDVWLYYENPSVKDKANSELANLSNMSTIADIKSKIIETIVCTEFHFSHISNVDSLLSKHTSDLSVDMTKYNSLKDKSSVKSGLIGTGHFTYAKLKEIFNGLVNAQAERETETYNNSGSGGGGFGGSPVSSFAGKLELTPSQTENPFSDVGENHWAKKYILDLYDKNIMNGKGNGLFEPNEKITRAETVKVIVEAFELKGNNEKKFRDVSDTEWFADYVSIAAENGVVEGDENLNFKPNDYVTRQDLAVMLYRAMNISVNAQETNFGDYGNIAVYARSAVNYFSAEGVINGYPDGNFVPYGNATRAEAAKIISSILE